MSLTARRNGSTAIFEFEGKLTIGTAVEDFRNGWMEAVKNGAKDVIVILAKVPLVDSSAIGSLIRCNSTIAANGGRLKIVGAADIVRQAFRVTRLDQVFEFHETEAGALGGH